MYTTLFIDDSLPFVAGFLSEMPVVPIHHFVRVTGHPGQPPGRIVGHTATIMSAEP